MENTLPANVCRLAVFGDSITVGQGASSASMGYAYRFARKLDLPITNHGLGGSGAFEASKQSFIAAGMMRDSQLWTCMAGFGDLNSGGIHPGTLTKIQGCHRAFLATAFMRMAVPCSDASVTKLGAWTDMPSAMFSKAEIGLCGKGKTTIEAGAQISWSFTLAAGESLVIGCYNSDGAVDHVANMLISIDGGTPVYYNGEGCSDGIYNGFDNERLTHEARVFPLAAGAHTVVCAPTSTAPIYNDYFGILAAPSACNPVLVAEPPYMTAGGLSVTRPNSQAASIAILQTVNEFSGYPIRFVRVNDYYDTATGVGTDGIHPNDYGHKRISKAFIESFRTMV